MNKWKSQSTLGQMKNEGLLCHNVLFYPNKTVVGGDYIPRDVYFLFIFLKKSLQIWFIITFKTSWKKNKLNEKQTKRENKYFGREHWN